ncbi:MAG: flagellar assembly protein FliW [Calditrichia bacterium]
MRVVTKQFGELDVSEEQVIHFPKGIIGFENCKNFVLIDDEDFEPFRWLISLDRKEFGFPVLDPFLIIENYEKEFPPSIAKEFKDENTLIGVFCVVTLKGEQGKVTINLKGPILIDYETREGKQIILTSDELSVSHPIS